MYHQVAGVESRGSSFAVVAVTACSKAPAPQSDPAPGSIRSTLYLCRRRRKRSGPSSRPTCWFWSGTLRN